MAHDLKPVEKDAIAKVKSQKCPVCDGPLIPRHDPDGSTVRAMACTKHGEYTTPQGRAKVRRARETRNAQG